MPRTKTQLGSRRQPEVSRQAIFDAALEEFAHEGVSGARMDKIADAAGVNKALLYYYFKDKESLYGALLDHVFAGLLEATTAVLDAPGTPRERFCAYVGAHFDYVAHTPIYPRLLQFELMRSGRVGSPHIKRLVTNYLTPIVERLAKLLQEGIDKGDFRKVDVRNFVTSTVAIITNYFLNAPITRILVPSGDPLSPERIADRRAAVLDMVGAALFADKQHC